MRTPRLYLFDPNLRGSGGHYLPYATGVAKAAEALGLLSIIVANVKADFAVAEARVLATLELDYWQEMSPGPSDDPYEHLSSSAEYLAGTFSRIQFEEMLCDDDVLFFPSVNVAQIMGLARWRRQAGIVPRTVLLFRRDVGEHGIDAAIGARAGVTLLRQALADLYACPGNARIRLLTDSDNLTEDHIQALRRGFQTAPIPVDPDLLQPRTASTNGCATLTYLGDARREKGYGALPVIARALNHELCDGRVSMTIQSNFNVANGEPGIDAARRFLSSIPNITVLQNPLTREQYNSYLLAAGLILLPYQADRYISRTSGILAEAICAGVPAIVPDGTWLADQVRHHGAGVIYDPMDPEGPAKGTLNALDSLDELQSKSANRRSTYARFHNPSRLAEFVCGSNVIRYPA